MYTCIHVHVHAGAYRKPAQHKSQRRHFLSVGHENVHQMRNDSDVMGASGNGTDLSLLCVSLALLSSALFLLSLSFTSSASCSRDMRCSGVNEDIQKCMYISVSVYRGWQHCILDDVSRPDTWKHVSLGASGLGMRLPFISTVHVPPSYPVLLYSLVPLANKCHQLLRDKTVLKYHVFHTCSVRVKHHVLSICSLVYTQPSPVILTRTVSLRFFFAADLNFLFSFSINLWTRLLGDCRQRQ